MNNGEPYFRSGSEIAHYSSWREVKIDIITAMDDIQEAIPGFPKLNVSQIFKN